MSPRTQKSELIPSSLVLSHNDSLAHQIRNGLIEVAVLSLDKCDIMWQVLLPFYQTKVDLSVRFTVRRLAHWPAVLGPLVGKEESVVLIYQQVLGENKALGAMLI